MNHLADWVILGVALLAAALGVAAFYAWDAWRKRRIGTLDFARRTFLTANETDFYRRLTEACGSDLLVFPQVSMGALIDSRLKPSHPLYWQVRQLFAGKICDFVLCDPRSLVPVLVVELDDKMHDFSRDEKRDRFLSRAGLGTMRFWSRKKPSATQLRRLLSERLPALKV